MPENSNQSKFENYSLDFDGTNSSINCGIPTYLNGKRTASISLWVKFTDSSTASYTDLVSVGDVSSGDLYLRINPSGSLRRIEFGITNSFARATSADFSDIASNTWIHLMGCVDQDRNDGTDTVIFLNGTQIFATNTNSTISNPVTENLFLGLQGPWNPLEGNLDQVAIWNTDQRANVPALFNEGTPVNPMSIAPPPSAYYDLGGSSTGSADDPANTLTVPNSSVPSATVFDFVSADGDRFVIPGLRGTGPVNGINGALTTSIWVNTTAGLIYEYAFNRDWVGGTNRDWNLRKDNFYGGGGRMIFSVFNTSNVLLEVRLTGSTDPQGDPLITMNDGKWHHIVGVYDGTETIELYTDGILQGTNTSAGHGAINTTARTAIGGVNNSTTISTGGGSWNGDLSNAQIWDTNLSSAEVVTLYNNGVPLLTGTQPETANLKGWWKMNVDTSAWDGTDWTISNSSANYPNSLQFNGTSSYIDTSSFTTSGDDVTISLWLNAINIAASTPSTTAALVYGNASNFIYYNVNEVIYARINGTDAILVANSGGVPQIFGTGNWHHLAVVKSGSTVTWYIDGNPYTNLGSGTTGGFTMNYIGAAGGSSIYFLNGQLSNVAIFESALDASAITTLYNGGQPEAAISSSPLSWWKLDNLSTGIQDSGSASNNGTNYGATISGIAVSESNGISFGMNTANLVNSDLTRSIPYSSYSMEFDSATDDYINVGTDSSLNVFDGDFSISIWFNHTNAAGSANAFLEFGAFTNRAAMTLGFTSNTGVGFAFGNPSVIPWYYNAGSGFNDGNWHNMVATRTGTTYKIFVDGVDLSYTTGTFNSAGVNRIGTTDYNTFYNGKLSNVAVFGSTLTEDQVLTIYNGGVPNNISSLSPVSWWSLAGDSYFNGNDWICPDLGSASNNGTSDNMGGEELVGDGPGSTANGIATSMDIPANLKGDAPNSSKNAFSINMTAIDRVEDVPA
jgi:hypothetical protein